MIFLIIKINGDFYDYSKVNYINNKTKVEIICPKHGSFFKDHMNIKCIMGVQNVP